MNSLLMANLEILAHAEDGDGGGGGGDGTNPGGGEDPSYPGVKYRVDVTGIPCYYYTYDGRRHDGWQQNCHEDPNGGWCMVGCVKDPNPWN